MSTEDQDLQTEVSELLTRGQTLMLATASAAGDPLASYAPFYFDGSTFHVYLSELSRHCLNLLERPRASLLFIEDERDCRQLFARRRLTIDCQTIEVARDSADFAAVMRDFGRRFGDIIQVIEPLTDFHLWRMQPQDAVYVRGFAQAFKVDPDSLGRVEHIRDD